LSVMRVIEEISDIEKIRKGCVLTIGNFDGVHIGHREILTAARETATQRKTEFVAMTFEPHPVAILHPEKAPGVLTPLELKKHLLTKYGVDCLIILKDSRELLNLSPQDFIDRFLVKNIQPDTVVEGSDFNFGVGRAGSIDTLQKLGIEKGFEVVVIEAKQIELSTGQAVRLSSTIIRYMLESGHVADAAAALGRPYRLTGKIVPGRGKGAKLGFPTLNMEKPEQIIPAENVYAGFVEIGSSEKEICVTKERIPAVFSLGQARTFGDEYPLLIEAHLLIEDVGDLIGKWLAMDFVQRIRSQHKFKTESQLAAQIANDCKKAKEILLLDFEFFIDGKKIKRN